MNSIPQPKHDTVTRLEAFVAYATAAGLRDDDRMTVSMSALAGKGELVIMFGDLKQLVDKMKRNL